MRAPFQVLVLLFRRTGSGVCEFAVLCRSDDGCWQGVAGGGENEETPAQAARREVAEETGISPTAPLYRLTMADHVPVRTFSARHEWPLDTYVIPQHFFACDATGAETRLSDEHSELRWLRTDEAEAILRYDDNRTALWELSQRLERDDLPSCCSGT
jgi:dATP pyrophosphohydrolase